MTEFSGRFWAYRGDDTAKQRVLRVLRYYDVDFWWMTRTIRFVTKDDEIIEWVERAVDGHDGRVEQIGEDGGRTRVRISFE